MRIDWIGKLQNLLQTLAFCLVVATIQYAFAPDRPWGPPVIYSLLIGSIIWAVIDLGRHAFPSAHETGWPLGYAGFGLVLGGILTGYLVGTWLGDQLCRYYGFNVTGATTRTEWRTSLLITLMAGGAGSYWFYAASKTAYLERKMGEVRRHADEARLKLLETQLEPHMLFNTLANLRALIGVDPPRAQHMLDHMIAYLRATLEASRATTHALQAEFDRLADYLALMSIRMGPRLAYDLKLSPDLAQQPVPTLLLQPLVENCIQHGLEPKVEGGRIDVVARREGDALRLDVADTGIGWNGAPPSSGSGFGLEQVRERLKTLYGDKASLAFEAPAEGGARAVILLPLTA